MTDTQSLRSLYGFTFITSALSNISLCLRTPRHGDAEPHFEWATMSNAEGHEVRPDPWDASDLLRVNSRLEAVLPGRSLPPYLAAFWRTRTIRGLHGAILSKKLPWWIPSCPTFCLWVFDGSRFEDEAELGQRISQVFYAGNLHAGQHVCSRLGCAPESDRAAITMWMKMLSAERAIDAQCPLCS